ncbi:hypothetical protein N7470_003844 [Penicillium chermesinum]|nr:hypothetical protein N7470_003844 [Penicillium chermesinum]
MAPPLELNQGDNVVFDVTNECPFNVTVHFHGIEQLGTPWSDGVPGMSQVPIREGHSFRYRWTAHQYGSYFYHAHHRGQLEDGLYGPIYIKPAASQEKPFRLIANSTNQLEAMQAAEAVTKPVIVTDWRLLNSEQVWAGEEASGLDAYCANALLINGKGSVSCLPQSLLNNLTASSPFLQQVLGNETLTSIGCIPPDIVSGQGDFPHNFSAVPPSLFDDCVPSNSPHELFIVDPAKQYISWDLISAAGVLHCEFSIDEHDMWVYAIDGQYIEPVRVNAISIPNANRYSVLVPLNKPRGDYTIRMVSGSPQQILNTTATLRYTGPPQLNRTSHPWITLTGANATADTIILNDFTTKPFPPVQPAATVDDTYHLTIGRYNASYRWTLGNASFDLALEESRPLLFDQHAIPSDLIIRTKNGTWVDFIMQVNSAPQPAHPIHKHSNKHFLIGQGTGIFNYSTVAEAIQEIPESFNLVNPPLRDTSATLDAGPEPVWMVTRYQVVNPGAFLMHCHIQVHQSGGMALALLDGVDEWPTVPPAYLLDSGF